MKKPFLKMKYLIKYYPNVFVELAYFRPVLESVVSINAMFHSLNCDLTFERQSEEMLCALNKMLEDNFCKDCDPVFIRCYMSDAANQQEYLENLMRTRCRCAVSFVQQTPLDGSKIALWVQLKSNCLLGFDGLYFYEHNGYRHYHTSNYLNSEEDSYTQTSQLFQQLDEELISRRSEFALNCVRTWLYVRDIDLNYKDVVKGRREFFQSHGLTSRTHFIASTGISGQNNHPHSLIQLDSYCIHGLIQSQISYLYAKDHLNSTSEYGVTFERGSFVEYGDRRDVMISGTASIDNRGNILYENDVNNQCRRVVENVEALLKEADCTFKDVNEMVIYLRDISDYSSVRMFFDQQFLEIPKLYVLAPVCRPGWLVEIECSAEKAVKDKFFRKF